MIARLLLGCVCNEACKVIKQAKMYIPLFKAGHVVWCGAVGYAPRLRDIDQLAWLCAVWGCEWPVGVVGSGHLGIVPR